MEPHVVDRIVSGRARIVEERAPGALDPAGRQQGTAHEVAAMMRLVVREGTGNRRPDPRILGRRQDGDRGDGHRGLEHDVVHRLRRPEERAPPEVAIAVVLQNQSGVGGTTAAPIARAVMQAILQRTENP